MTTPSKDDNEEFVRALIASLRIRWTNDYIPEPTEETFALIRARDAKREAHARTTESSGQHLRRIRKASGKSMGDLARFLGVSVVEISDIELDRNAEYCDVVEAAKRLQAKFARDQNDKPVIDVLCPADLDELDAAIRALSTPAPSEEP